MKLELRNISVIYDEGQSSETIGLPEVNFTFESGQPVVLTGHNGCGKTTLLKVLSGLLKCTTGEIWRTTEDDKAKTAQVNASWLRTNSAYLRQQPVTGMFPDLTLAENVSALLVQASAFVPYFASDSFDKTERNLADLVLFYNTHRTRRFSELSGGQQQLFAVGCSGTSRRHLLLFDEPTSALDADARPKTEALLQSICGNPAVISVITTHDFGLAERLGFQSTSFQAISTPPP